MNAYKNIYQIEKENRITRVFIILFIVMIVILFLPWTQNIRAKGSITTLQQEQRRQEVNTIIAGKVVKWWVKEGDAIKAGDTIMQLSEVKFEYLDPLLLERIMQTGLASAGRYLTVRIRIKDKPGSLAKLLTEIGGIGANILDVFHLRTDPMLALDEVAVNITMETRGTEHEKDVLTRIKALGHDAQVQ